MTAEERERVQRLCTLIQNEKEQSKLTQLMQELFELLDSSERRRGDYGDEKGTSP